MPRKFQVAQPPAGMRVVDEGDAKAQKAKVKRQHIPQWEKRKWTTVQSMFYPYDKLKGEFELQGLFTRMKDRCWMAIYYDLILMYQPTKDGPPVMDDKYEGKPFGYFFIDNIVDSEKIESDEKKLTIDLPTQNSRDNLRIVCDTPQQFKEWLTTITELAKVFETTPRDGIETREAVEAKVAEIQKDIPLAFEPLGFMDNLPHTKGMQWLEEMRLHFDNHRKHLPWIERIERFSAYRVGPVAVYCNFYQGRDRDGPVEILEKTKKKVFAFWEAEVERIIKLNDDVVAEGPIDADHKPFHMEDCQIAVFLVDLINHYSVYVHGVAPHKLVLQKSVQTLEEQYFKLQAAQTK